MKAVLLLALLAAAPAVVRAEGVSDALTEVRTAALKGDTAAAAPRFADDLVIVSQSGKVYGKGEALKDLGNGFVAWDNREVTVAERGGAATVTLINRRQRAGMDPAEFRVSQQWRREGGRWRLAAQTSVPLPAATALDPALDAKTIVLKAYEAAGGDTYRYPKSYHLTGIWIDYRAGPVGIVYKPYDLYRIQPAEHPRGRMADGKIRVSAYKDGKPVSQIAFDGAITYDMSGPTGQGGDAPFWRTTMGFGMIRFALAPGYTATRVADDSVDGKPAYNIKVTDPAGESAVFSVRGGDWRLVKVAFATPRGLHERIFSEFKSKPGLSWVQPMRIRSFIGGIKEAEFVYDSFEIGPDLDPKLFFISPGQFAPALPPPTKRPSAAEVAAWWIGSYDNSAQLSANAAIGGPAAPELTADARRITVERLTMPQLGEQVLLLQEYKLADAPKALRSRVFVLRDQPDGAVRAVQHFFTTGPTYDRAPVVAADVVKLSAKDFTLQPGCDLIVRWDAANKRYRAAMAPRTCTYSHPVDGPVYAEYEQLMWPGQFWYRDRSIKLPSGEERGAIDGFAYLRFDRKAP